MRPSASFVPSVLINLRRLTIKTLPNYGVISQMVARSNHAAGLAPVPNTSVS